MSSTLSDALNPFASQTRTRNAENSYAHTPYQSPSQALIQQSQPPPPSGELEVAIPEPPAAHSGPRKPSAESVQAVQELLRVVYATREAHEIERKRRIAWEQEQEAKHIQRQAEMERQMLEMRQELSSLRAQVRGGVTASSSVPRITGPEPTMPPATSQDSHLHSPVSPIVQIMSPSARPTFIQGSSAQPLRNWSVVESAPDSGLQNRSILSEAPMMSLTPSPSPHLATVQASNTYCPPAVRRKRRSPKPHSDHGASSSGSESSSSTGSRRPSKRISHHDTRCLTVHHAMRLHLKRLMALESDKTLPDSHVEGQPLNSDAPVRFVWDKTTKQSVHNARMKNRVISDLKENRRLYKDVPDKEFGKKVLDSVFEQCFTTFRQKFKIQRDTDAAENLRKREDSKAHKARRLARRKAKLNSRAEARITNKVFDHIMFDGAFHIDCMSSEESDFEGADQSVLCTRGYAWRSMRLNHFFHALDEEDRRIQASRPKRGSGRKDRLTGPHKDGFQLPPKGISTWMISKRWITAAQRSHPDLQDALKNRIVDPEDLDESRFETLGEESGLDETGSESQADHRQPTQPEQNMHHYQELRDVNGQLHPYYTTGTSSLSFAFV